MTFFILYLLMILENIQGYLLGISVAFGAISFAYLFFRAVNYIDLKGEEEAAYKVMNGQCKWFLGICLVSALFSNLIPSKQDMAIIAAGGITYNIATSDKAAELGNKSIELLSKKLDQMIEDPVKATKDVKAIAEEVKK